MTTLQEIVDLADAMQLRGDERKEFIAEEMEKLHNLQAGERERKRSQTTGWREGEIKISQITGWRKSSQTTGWRERKRSQTTSWREGERKRSQITGWREGERKSCQTTSRREWETGQIEDSGTESTGRDWKIRAEAGVKTGGGAVEGTTGIYADQVKPKLPRLPAFVDGKYNLDSRLLRFERFANTSGWPKENWCASLSALLTGRALEVFCRLSESEAINYDRVKEVLQKRYLTEDGYRQKFRAGTPEDGENPSMFIVRLKTYLERWMKLSETPQTYDGLEIYSSESSFWVQVQLICQPTCVKGIYLPWTELHNLLTCSSKHTRDC